MPDCKHLSEVADVMPRTEGCEECMALGDPWIGRRMCRTCGHVGCCDKSKNRHATQHFRDSGHPIARSIEPGEDWSWCYVDALLMMAPCDDD